MVGQTTCNGDAFHAQLPAIRKSVQALVSASSNRAPTWASWAFDGSTRTASLIVKDPDSGVSTSSTEFQLQENGTWGGWRKVPGKRGDNNTMTLIVPYIRATANAIQFRATDTAGAQSTSPVYSFPAGVNVDNRFEHYFLVHDGMRTLGKPLTPLLVKDGIALQYFEKGRLEDHSKETSNPDWQIQYGLLVDELHNAKANLPIGGDTSSLTYAGLHDIADPARRVQPPPGYKGYGVYTVAPDGTTFVPFTADLRGAPGHMILGGFWNFINRADLFSGGWFHDLGLPISDPIPATVTKNFPGGPAKRNIMVQAFQRAILTYDPANPADWQIERANVGTDYLKVFS
jgi:hypothetical protein